MGRVFLILALLVTAQIAAAAPIVRAVEIEGLESMEQAEIVDLLQSRVGEPLDMESVRADQRTIFNIGIFSPEISAYTIEEENGVRLVYTVHENPIVSEITITGNLTEPTATLESLLDQREGERLFHTAQRDAEQRIRGHYERRGHSRVRVRSSLEDLPDGTVAIAITIDEGEVLIVSDVEITGNERYGDLRLGWHMVTRPSGILGDNHYNEELFDQDLAELRQFHFDRGFLDVSVRQGEIDVDPEKRSVALEVIIEEGPRYRFDGVTVEGNTLFSDLEIQAVLRDLSGKWFNAEKLRVRLDEVRRMLGDQGHINAVVEPRLRPDPETGAVNIALHVREGPRVSVGGIYLQRTLTAPDMVPPISSTISRIAEQLSPPVTDDTVRRFVELKEGGVYRTYEEVKTAERLRRLGIFESVNISRQPTTDPTVEDAVITVDQQSTGFLTVGVGLGDETGVFGFSRLTERNLFGVADTLQASVLFGTRAIDFNVSYLNRFLGDSDWSMRTTVYDTSLRRDEYDEDRTGGDVEFSHPLGEDWTISQGLRAEYARFDPDGNVSDELEDAMDSYWAMIARLRLTEDHRDVIDWPTEGWMRAAQVEAGWADDWLVKLTGDWEWYRELRRDVILAWNVEGGVIARDMDQVAFGERLFLGGSQDLRGFEFRGAGRVDSQNDDLHVGGVNKLLSQVELRFPIWKQLRGVTFLDAGQLSDTALDFGGWRASTGAGLRFGIPGFGSVALDLGFAFISRKNDDRQTLHFTFRSEF
jgi:outer membrane protein insertion porin family